MTVDIPLDPEGVSQVFASLARHATKNPAEGVALVRALVAADAPDAATWAAALLNRAGADGRQRLLDVNNYGDGCMRTVARKPGNSGWQPMVFSSAAELHEHVAGASWRDDQPEADTDEPGPPREMASEQEIDAIRNGNPHPTNEEKTMTRQPDDDCFMPRPPSGTRRVIRVLEAFELGGQHYAVGEAVPIPDEVFKTSLDAYGRSFFDYSRKEQIDRLGRQVWELEAQHIRDSRDHASGLRAEWTSDAQAHAQPQVSASRSIAGPRP